jgi:hypothetical protein
MSLSCLFGVHRPSLGSIARRRHALIGLCENCGRPLVKSDGRKWDVAPPLAGPLPDGSRVTAQG